jgi:hypothetical protein
MRQTRLLSAMHRRSTPKPGLYHPVCPVACAKFALHAMYAHRLWTKLWITLGQPEENSKRPEGNARVTSHRQLPAHSRARRSARVSHSPCAHPHRGLAGQTAVIPGIHRPYDDYQFCIRRQITIKVGKRPGLTRCADPLRRFTPLASGPDPKTYRPDKEGDR